MLDFKPRRQLKLKPNTPLSAFLSNSGIRFVVAGFFSLLVTLLLFIFMNYLIGNFDKYAQAITENLFSLRLVQLDKSSAAAVQPGIGKWNIQRVQRPPEPPLQPQPQADDDHITNAQRRRMMIESLLGKNKESDKIDSGDSTLSNSE